MSAPQPGRTWELDGVRIDDPFNNHSERRHDPEWWHELVGETSQPLGNVALSESVATQ